MFKIFFTFIDSIIARDPAARSRAEVIFLYSGVHAMILHRIAHRLWRVEYFFLASAVSHFSRFLTGVEVHPGAVIGQNLYLHHAIGIVIGETAIIGDDVMIFHQVTLGAVSREKGKRHPTIGNGVTIGAGAKLLGAITIGDGARIGANAVVVQDVAAGASVGGIPARVLTRIDADYAI